MTHLMRENSIERDNNESFHLSISDYGTAVSGYGRRRESNRDLFGILDHLNELISDDQSIVHLSHSSLLLTCEQVENRSAA